MTDSPETGNSGLDTTVPQPARRYDYLLGGKDNFERDRDSADQIEQELPQIKAAVTENRSCRARMVRHLADECGISQFLDIGCGLPLGDNVHQIAQRITPEARIVYVDNDKLVAVHARALMVSSAEGKTTFHQHDLRESGLILKAARETLDFTRPVGLLLVAVLHFLPDTGEALAAVRELVAALPSGSYLALTHSTYDPLPEQQRAALAHFSQPDSAEGPFQPRTREQVAAFLDGLHLTRPGLVSTIGWRPDLWPPADPKLSEADAICYAALAVKP